MKVKLSMVAMMYAWSFSLYHQTNGVMEENGNRSC